MNEKTKIKVNSGIYDKDAVIRTIEILSNRFYCELESSGSYFIITISEKFSLSSEVNLNDIFFDHLNNQVIRRAVFEETKNVRNFIVGKALFETEAFDEQSNYFDINQYDDEDNYILDPKNISDN